MSTMPKPVSPQPRTTGRSEPAEEQPSSEPAARHGCLPSGRTSAVPDPRAAELQPAHAALICVQAPHLAVSAEHGQLNGEGMEGFYYAGRRVVARCRLLLGGREPLPLHGRMLNAGQAQFSATARTTLGGGPDPSLVVDRLRSADGTERITLRNTGARMVRLPLELRCGTDLAEIAAIAIGRAGNELPASVHGSGLSWSEGALRAVVSAEPRPHTRWAQLGLLRWDWELPPGAERSVLLETDLVRPPTLQPARSPKTKSRGKGRKKLRETERPVSVRAAERAPRLWRGARVDADDPRVTALFRAGLDDVNALLLKDPAEPSDLHLAAGAPWRCALAPAESLRAARMMLPLGTRLAAGTLRTLARGQLAGANRDAGRLPGPLRHAGPYAPASCSGTEATLLFPAVLAEARLWGLPESDTQQLLPTAERCLTWMVGAAGEGMFVPDPAPDGPYRCEVQARAHRAALLGADLLEACGGEGGDVLREWADELAHRFREEFWVEEEGEPVLVTVQDPAKAPCTHLGSVAAELLDTGLAAGGRSAPGLLTTEHSEQLCRLLVDSGIDSGWGLRSLTRDDARHNPFGYRGGAVRVQESVTAVTRLAAAGHDAEACALLDGVLDAAAFFGYRLPEMYAAGQRAEGAVPVPHPAACRPAAVAAASSVHLITALAGVRPDAPGGTVSVQPVKAHKLGALRLAGLRIAGKPFTVRVSGSGEAEVEELPDGMAITVS